MILPSIDLHRGQAVQWIGGKKAALEAGDPMAVASRFAIAGELAVVDLDAALEQGNNRGVIEALVARYPCRVGGGIRDLAQAEAWLDAGASKIVLGTAATPELLRDLPADRVVAALDADRGEVVVRGWRQRTGRGISDRMQELNGLVGGYLVTFVEQEGRMAGTHLEQVAGLMEAADGAELVIAGGIHSEQEIAALAQWGVKAQLGMALYTGKLSLADALAAPLQSDRPDGLWATVVCDEAGKALGLAWSNRDSLRQAVESRRGVYHSRSRGLWRKGESSGAEQELLRVALDCDRDALCFWVRQKSPGFCHQQQRSCWGEDGGLHALFRRLQSRKETGSKESYTARLMADPGFLTAKLAEESQEFVEAFSQGSADWTKVRRQALLHEAADLFYFSLSALLQAGLSLEQLEAELDRRARRWRHRHGPAKSAPTHP